MFLSKEKCEYCSSDVQGTVLLTAMDVEPSLS